eukprot:CAMPEP_0119306926 /NCGR_PEP_ID=MMETSP1333-20130426/7562_1 /TAXON_ID=418940 /ORGANISM="Scyphosphaera apsteinii, Strain RCC1455" /LENGTH=245 /DNA_ID=CAMNT_0007310359 /DNA_START=25 /DNA_END=762 /DNA_ORIENTATION=-
MADSRVVPAPQPHSGKLHKKSPGSGPSGWFYQEREFTLAEAQLSYRTGKGLKKCVQFGPNSEVQLYSRDSLEFSVSGINTVVDEGSASVIDRVYRFRADSEMALEAWIRAFKAHIAYEVTRQECQSDQIASMRPNTICKAMPQFSGTLFKKSPVFPHPWQKRTVMISGGSLFYESGNGSQKGISLVEVEAIRMVDVTTFEFLIQTRTKSYVFRAPDRAQAMDWVFRLQRIHQGEGDRTDQELYGV